MLQIRQKMRQTVGLREMFIDIFHDMALHTKM